jgi:hypothetical protein
VYFGFAMVRLIHAVLESTLLVSIAWGVEDAGHACVDGATSLTTALIQRKKFQDKIQHVREIETPEVDEDDTRNIGGLTDSQSQCMSQYADGLDEIRDGLGGMIRAHPGTVVAVTDRPMVFGVGSGTTGTWGLTQALHTISQPGQKVSHWLNSPPENCKWIASLLRIFDACPDDCRDQLRRFDFTAIADSVIAILDTPVFEVFLDLFLSFPKATWILTTRPSGDWAKRRKERHLNSLFPIQEPCGLAIDKNTTQKELAAMFDLTNDFIRCMVPSERLMELDMFSSNVTDSAVGDIAAFLNTNNFTTELLAGVPFSHTKQLPEEECKDVDDVKMKVSFDSC